MKETAEFFPHLCDFMKIALQTMVLSRPALAEPIHGKSQPVPPGSLMVYLCMYTLVDLLLSLG